MKIDLGRGGRMPTLYFVAYGLTFQEEADTILDPLRSCPQVQAAVSEEYRRFILNVYYDNEILVDVINYTHGLKGVVLDCEVEGLSEAEVRYWRMQAREFRLALRSLTELEDIRVTDREPNAEYRKYVRTSMDIRSHERVLQRVGERGSKENQLRILLEVFLHLDRSSYRLKRVRRKATKKVEHHLHLNALHAKRLGLPVDSGYMHIDKLIEMVNQAIVDVNFWEL
jgi:hypothetical protein